MSNIHPNKTAQPVLGSLFANPKLAEIADGFRVKPGKGFRHSLAMEFYAFLAIVLGCLVFYPTIAFIFAVPWILLGLLFSAVGLRVETHLAIVRLISGLCSYYIWYALVARVFFKLRREAKRTRLNALTALSRRPEDPILYLRSFVDDERMNPISRGQKTYEEDLALALSTIGPVVAIGNPHEHSTPLGATRVYLKQDNWQENAKRLMQISQLIIIQAGKSEGLIWELEAALETIEPRRVIMSFLVWQHLGKAERQVKYRQFRMQVDDYMNQSPSPVTIKLPEKIGNAQFMVFSDDWTPELVKIPRWKKWLFRFSSSLFVTEALRPVLRNRNLKLSRWKTAPYLIFVLWLIFGFAFTIYRFPDVYIWQEPWLARLLNISFVVGGFLVFAWSTANIFLFLLRALRSLMPDRKAGLQGTT